MDGYSFEIRTQEETEGSGIEHSSLGENLAQSVQHTVGKISKLFNIVMLIRHLFHAKLL